MSIIERMERRMAGGSTGALADSWYQPGGFFFGGIGTATKAGSAVSEFNAMRLAIVWCCIKILSEDSASLPLHLYRRLPGGGKQRGTEHPLYSFLHDSPNPEMTAFTFRETLKSHILSWGNGYAEKVYGKGTIGRNVIQSLWPITPHRVTVKRNKGEVTNIPVGQVYYHVSMAGTGLPDVDLPRQNILHIPGLSYNGLIGYSPIGAAREAIGLGMSLEEFGASYFGQGLNPGVVVSHPGKLDPVTHANMRDALSVTYSGLGKAHRLMLLEEGLKVEKVGIPNNDAQFLETRKFTNIDIGTRIYRLPPQMYGEYDKASTYASAEEFNQDYVVKTLRPWLVRLEQAFNMSLLTQDERREYFYEHLIDGLMRGNATARADYYTKMFNIGAITDNEINELENRNPIGPEGDKRFVPLNMIPLDQAGMAQEPTANTQNARTLYQKRLESAYRHIFRDASDRIVRKEVKRLRFLLGKHANNGIDAAFVEFYQDFPEYVQNQLIPACLSYSEAFLNMQEELNGLKYDDFRAKLGVFVRQWVTNYAQNWTKKAMDEIKRASDINVTLDDWTNFKAVDEAMNEVTGLSEAIKENISV